MAGHNKAKGVATLPNQRTRKARRNNRRNYADLYAAAADAGMARARSGPAEQVLQEVLDRAVGAMRYAASEVDKLDPDEFWVRKIDAQGNILAEPNKWYQLEQMCREEVRDLAEIMSKLGLAERLVRIEEAQAELLKRAIVDAARDAGIGPAEIRKLGTALRDRLQLIQGGQAERPAA